MPVCPECNGELPEGAKEGLCPQCLMVQGLKIVSALAPPGPGPPRGDLPRNFGDYELLEEIARGGMGIVYRARQRSLDRIVAVKTLLLSAHASPESVKRLRAEASAAASLRHPNIVAIHEVGMHQDEHYLVMDYVAGPSLAKFIKGKPLPVRHAAGHLKTIAEAIHYAHERGILHRDLKPSNVLIGSNDEPLVTDFGLAKRFGSDSQLSTQDSQLTVTGQVVGSPGYMPPEQAAGPRGKVGRGSDVYSLGAMLYHLLTDRPPFVGETLNETLDQVFNREPLSPRLLNPAVPRDLETICLKCLEKEPEKRYATAQEFADELGRFLRGEPIHARPVSAPEKLWRWCRRKPALAGALATALLLLLVVAIGAPIAAFRISHARHQAEQNLYAADMNLAFKALEAKNRGQVLRLLERHLPRNLRDRDLRGWEWRYLWRESKSDELFALPGTKHEMTSVAFSPDGKYLATGEGRGRVTIWDLATTQAVAHAESQLIGAVPLQFSPDGRLLASGTWSEGGLRLWDWNPPNLTSHASPLTNGRICGVRLDEKTITAVTPQFLRRWDRTTGRELLSFPIVSHQPNWEAWAIFSPDGRIVATSSNGVVMLWDIGAKAMIKQPLLTSEEVVNPIAFSRDGRTLAAGGKSGALFLWDAPSHRMITNFVAHRSVVEWGDFSPDGKLFVTASYDQTLKLWDTADWQEPKELHAHLNVIFSVAFSPDGKRIASASADGTVRFWSATPGARADDHKNLPADVRQWSLSPDGQWLFLIFADQNFSVWDLATWGESARQPLGSTNITATALFPSGRRVALGDANGRVFIFDLATMQGESVGSNFEGAEVVALNCSADGSILAGRATNHRIIAWSASSGGEIARFTSESTHLLHGLPIAKDGRTVATAPLNGTVELWALPGLRKQTLYVSDIEPVSDVAFFSDGRRLATVDVDLTARVWNLSAPERPLVTMHADLTGLMCVALSPDERRLAAGEDITQPNRVKVWDVVTGRELAGLTGHKFRITDVAFWPDGNTIVSVSKDAVFVWRGASLAEIEADEKGQAAPP
ncbi:MAG: protein kinase [Verrucomicrobiota bacterium]